MLLHKVADQTFENFSKTGWPNCLLVTGENSPEKISYLENVIEQELYRSRFNRDSSIESIKTLVQQKIHPDYFVFYDARIPIGDSDKPEEASVRYLLRHFLPYYPKVSNRRFIFFHNAARILDEAESALLKSLEEPPAHTYFILCAESVEAMKETIVSRSLQIHLPTTPNIEQLPSEAWDRFWFLHGYGNGPAWEAMKKQDWHNTLQNFYDTLSFNASDFVLFDRLLNSDFKKKFGKELLDIQNKIIDLSLRPLQYAIRDILVAGPVPEFAPIRLPKTSNKKTLRQLNRILNVYFYRLQLRYFGTRPANSSAILYSFFSRFAPLWAGAFSQG